MGRAPCCDKSNVKRGPWSPEEDSTLKSYIEQHGTGGNWIALPQKIGLKRCGKSCRLRWLNYLRPNIKHGGFSEEEESIICSLYMNIGSRWSIIAAQLPGRTDNDIKNYWNTRLKKKLLGKQRKEQQQARRANFLRQQEAKKRENFGNFVTPNNDPLVYQIPYWPAMVPNSLVMPSTTNTNFSYPVDDISCIQGQILANSMSTSCSTKEIENSYCDVSNPNLYDVGLSELDELLYGLESLGTDMINGDSSSESALVSYPPMLGMNYELFEQVEGFVQNPTFDESRYCVGMQ